MGFWIFPFSFFAFKKIFPFSLLPNGFLFQRSILCSSSSLALLLVVIVGGFSPFSLSLSSSLRSFSLPSPLFMLSQSQSHHHLEYFTLSKPLVEGCDCPLLSHSPISTLHSLSHPTIHLPSRQLGTHIHRPMWTTNIIFYAYRHVWVAFCLPHKLPQFSNIIITFLPYYIRKNNIKNNVVQ